MTKDEQIQMLATTQQIGGNIASTSHLPTAGRQSENVQGDAESE
jgi:hypothetical protein